MRQIWGGRAGEKNRLQYFEFGLQYLVQPLGVNPTYSTFNKCINVIIKLWKNTLPMILQKKTPVSELWQLHQKNTLTPTQSHEAMWMML